MKKKIISLMTALVVVVGLVGVMPVISGVSEETRYESGDFVYQIFDDGTVEITGYNGDATDLSIPDTIDGKKVTSLGDSSEFSYVIEGAFAYCKSLKSVTIPNGVKNIGRGAFTGCENLTSISIPESVTSIGVGAFAGTPWLEIKRAENPLVIVNNILVDGETAEGTVVIPDGVTKIVESTFDGCANITKITIPESVISIGQFAFSGTQWLENKRLENPLVIVNNFLIDGQTAEGDVVIPDGVTRIADGAFERSNGLTSVIIPDSVTSIGDWAFYCCESLNSITISSSVTSIGYKAFGYTWGIEDGDFLNWIIKIKGYKIYCYAGTAGEQYAIDNGFDYVLKDKTTGDDEEFSDEEGGNDFLYDGYLICRILDNGTIEIEFLDHGVYIDSSDKLIDVEIPSTINGMTVTSIRSDAFIIVSDLDAKSVTIPRSITIIGDHALGYSYDYDTEEYVKRDDFTIYCYSGTAGEQYAIDNGFNYVLLDDNSSLATTTSTASSLSASSSDSNPSTGTVNAVISVLTLMIGAGFVISRRKR